MKINLKDQGLLGRPNLNQVNHHLCPRAFNSRCSLKMNKATSHTLRASPLLWLLAMKILTKVILSQSKTLWLKVLRPRVKIVKLIYGRSFQISLFGSLSSKNSTVRPKLLSPRFLAKSGIRLRPINSCPKSYSCFLYFFLSFINSSGELLSVGWSKIKQKVRLLMRTLLMILVTTISVFIAYCGGWGTQPNKTRVVTFFSTSMLMVPNSSYFWTQLLWTTFLSARSFHIMMLTYRKRTLTSSNLRWVRYSLESPLKRSPETLSLSSQD